MDTNDSSETSQGKMQMRGTRNEHRSKERGHITQKKKTCKVTATKMIPPKVCQISSLIHIKIQRDFNPSSKQP